MAHTHHTWLAAVGLAILPFIVPDAGVPLVLASGLGTRLPVAIALFFMGPLVFAGISAALARCARAGVAEHDSRLEMGNLVDGPAVEAPATDTLIGSAGGPGRCCLQSRVLVRERFLLLSTVAFALHALALFAFGTVVAVLVARDDARKNSSSSTHNRDDGDDSGLSGLAVMVYIGLFLMGAIMAITAMCGGCCWRGARVKASARQ
jgi:hypothetical protein